MGGRSAALVKGLVPLSARAGQLAVQHLASGPGAIPPRRSALLLRRGRGGGAVVAGGTVVGGAPVVAGGRGVGGDTVVGGGGGVVGGAGVGTGKGVGSDFGTGGSGGCVTAGACCGAATLGGGSMGDEAGRELSTDGGGAGNGKFGLPITGGEMGPVGGGQPSQQSGHARQHVGR